MTEIDFYSLSRPVQDSLLDSLGGKYAPLPLLVRPGALRGASPWVLLSIAGGALLVLLCVLGFGDTASALSLHATWALGLYAILASAVAVGIFSALAFRTRAAALPFPPAIYVFPANVIDAREHVLRVFPLGEASSVTASAGGEIAIAFPGARFFFPLADPATLEETIRQIEASAERMRSPLDPEERRRVDPLAEPSVVSPLASDVSLTRVPPLWERHRYVVGVLLGAAVGAGVYFGRNTASDARMLAFAKKHDDEASYRAYLARGRAHKNGVAQVLLPRAALKNAKSKGTVEAIDAFAKEFPATGIQDEVKTARREALTAELERVRGAGTFEAVFGFGDKYPQHGLGPAYDAAKHALYSRALERHKKETPQLADFLAKLVAFSEKAGPRKTSHGYRGSTVEVRVRRLPSKELDRADESVKKSPTYAGAPSLPSTHLGPSRFEFHEGGVSDGFAKALSALFEPEIVTFERGPALDASATELPKVKVPTIAVSYRVETSGAAYASKIPRGIFLGLVFFFTTDFVLPGDSHPHRAKFTITEKIPFKLLRKDGPGDGLEAIIYEEMVRAGFADFRERYLAQWKKKN